MPQLTDEMISRLVQGRNPLEQSFGLWLRKQSPLVRAMLVLSLDDNRVGLAIQHSAISLKGDLTSHGLSIAAEHKGDCWDFLLDLDVYPAPVDGGYQCHGCPAGERPTFADLDALWVDHLFQPLAEWVQDELLPARGLAFFSHGGATWARLVRRYDDVDGATSVVWA